jgi:hypothetical protein
MPAYGPATLGMLRLTVFRRRICWPGKSASKIASGQLDVTAPFATQLDQRNRVDHGERDVLGDLVLPGVLVNERCVHASQIVVQQFAGEQPLAQAVPVAELDEACAFDAQLVLVGPFGALGQVVGALVTLVVQGGVWGSKSVGCGSCEGAYRVGMTPPR